MQNSFTPTEYDTWDHFLDDYEKKDMDELSWFAPNEFDERFYYYSENVPLSMELSHADLAETTDDREYEKCNEYRWPEMRFLEVRGLSIGGIVEGKDKR